MGLLDSRGARRPVIAVGASMGGGCALAIRAAARPHPRHRSRRRSRGTRCAGTTATTRGDDRDDPCAGAGSRVEGSGPAPGADEAVAVVEALRDRPDDRAVVASLAVSLLVAVGGAADPMIPVESARAPRETSAFRWEARRDDPRGGHLAGLDQPASFTAPSPTTCEICDGGCRRSSTRVARGAPRRRGPSAGRRARPERTHARTSARLDPACSRGSRPRPTATCSRPSPRKSGCGCAATA